LEIENIRYVRLQSAASRQRIVRSESPNLSKLRHDPSRSKKGAVGTEIIGPTPASRSNDSLIHSDWLRYGKYLVEVFAKVK
jgi:hypothetical protein